MSKTVMFIHGAWVTPVIWERFMGRYSACGYTCVAPAWPFLDAPVDALRQAPPAGLASLSVESIVAHYESLIRRMPSPPFLVGHCFGGLFVQMLLDRGVGAAGVAIGSVPPRGVRSGWTATRSVLPLLLRWRGWQDAVVVEPERFGRDFANGLSDAERPLEYRRHMIPAPGRLLYQSSVGWGTRVSYDNDRRAPLLLIAGDNDRMIQPSMVRSNYRRQRRSVAVTSFKRFEGRSHWLVAEQGWEQVADYSINWLLTQS